MVPKSKWRHRPWLGNALLAIGLPHNKLYHHAGGVPNIPYNSSFTTAVKAAGLRRIATLHHRSSTS